MPKAEASLDGDDEAHDLAPEQRERLQRQLLGIYKDFMPKLDIKLPRLLSCKNAAHPACDRSLLSGRSSAGRGTSGAHHRERCPEALRNAEIASAGQTLSLVHRPRPEKPSHKTRPTGRLAVDRSQAPGRHDIRAYT